MDESMKEVQKAATEFLKDLMTPKDRCFFVTFSDAPRLASSFTTDRDRLGQLIGDLKAHGMTALWDALETGLFQFQGIRGRKAFVVLTDGEDTASKKRYETVLDYARKSGVAVYVIGMNLPVNRQDIRYKMSRLAKETGGAVYHIASARGLAKIYKQIDEELRSQYLLTYIPKSAGKSGKWRKVEVKMAAEEMTARTIAGYYP
jgi:VWFA-related protein